MCVTIETKCIWPFAHGISWQPTACVLDLSCEPLNMTHGCGAVVAFGSGGASAADTLPVLPQGQVLVAARS